MESTSSPHHHLLSLLLRSKTLPPLILLTTLILLARSMVYVANIDDNHSPQSNVISDTSFPKQEQGQQHQSQQGQQHQSQQGQQHQSQQGQQHQSQQGQQHQSQQGQKHESLAVMQVPRCNCSKLVPATPADPSIGVHDTTCEAAAVVRGPGQSVVAFTFYDLGEYPLEENKNKVGRGYDQGIRENLALVKQYYPGFVMRLYYQVLDEGSHVLGEICTLACSEPMLDICDASHNPMFGNATRLYPLIWRFLPAIDDQVDLFLSRDLDSRISPREVAAVAEFVASPFDLHVMRDHPAHTTFLMGGMWGAKVKEVRKEFQKAFKKIIKDPLSQAPRNKGGFDQICLDRHVWPWARRRTLSHDAYLCQRFRDARPFPTRREEGVGNYVGSIVSLNASVEFDDKSECPERCRPKDHPDWTYC